MINRIIKKKQETHSPNGKSSEGSHTQTQKPSPYIEKPHRVTIPLVVSTTRPNYTTTVQVLQKPKQWMHRKQNPTIQPTARNCNMHLCQWVRKKRAKNKLARYHKMEKERAIRERIEKEREEIEKRAVKHFEMQALRKQYEIPTPKSSTKIEPPSEKHKVYYQDEDETKKRLKRERKELEDQALKHFQMQESYYKTAPKTKEKKINRKKLEQERKKLEKQALKHLQKQESYKSQQLKKAKVAKKAAYAKPKISSKAVKTRKKFRRYDDLGLRFINCFYKFCCQLYCCFTCFLIIGFVVIVIL